MDEIPNTGTAAEVHFPTSGVAPVAAVTSVGGVSPGRPYTHRRTRRDAPGPRRSGTSAGLCHRFGISAAAPAKREDASNILAKVCRNRSIKNVLSCTSWPFMAHSNKKIDYLVEFLCFQTSYVDFWACWGCNFEDLSRALLLWNGNVSLPDREITSEIPKAG